MLIVCIYSQTNASPLEDLIKNRISPDRHECYLVVVSSLNGVCLQCRSVLENSSPQIHVSTLPPFKAPCGISHTVRDDLDVEPAFQRHAVQQGRHDTFRAERTTAYVSEESEEL